MKNIKHLIIILLVVMTTLGYSQSSKQLNFVGKVIDKTSRQPLEYATISLFNKDNNKLITGGVTNDKGRFRVSTKLPLQSLFVKIEYIGYQPIIIRELKASQSQVDLGVVSVAPDKKMPVSNRIGGML